MPSSRVTSAVRGLILAAIFVVGAMAEIALASGLAPHCTYLTVESAGGGRTAWTASEILTIGLPALLIVGVTYVVPRTPKRATGSSTGASVGWAVLTGVVIASIGVLFEGSDVLC
jgi:hypothetical protein